MTRLLGFLSVGCALVLGSVWVAAQTDLATFEPGTPILSSEVNANFAALDEAIAALEERGGVEALNALTGAVELVAGTGIDIRVDADDGTVTIAGSAVDGGDGDDDGIPGGAVMAFDLARCPDGWSDFALAQGRTIVGTRTTVSGTVGTPLRDLEERTHTHVVSGDTFTTSSSGGHRHLWAESTESNGELIWTSGDGQTMMVWGNGIDNDGSGFYPIAVDREQSRSFRTDSVSDHAHNVEIPTATTRSAAGHLPYVQLRYCQRD